LQHFSLNSVTGLSSVIRSEDKTVPVRPGSSYLSFVSSSPAEVTLLLCSPSYIDDRKSFQHVG